MLVSTLRALVPAAAARDRVDVKRDSASRTCTSVIVSHTLSAQHGLQRMLFRAWVDPGSKAITVCRPDFGHQGTYRSLSVLSLTLGCTFAQL
jgi:hypothetical protein